MIEKASFLAVADDDFFDIASGKSPNFLKTQDIVVLKIAHCKVG